MAKQLSQEGGPVRGRHQFVERKNFMPEPIPPPEEVEEEERRSGWRLERSRFVCILGVEKDLQDVESRSEFLSENLKL